jgi:hypothetical protein
VFQGDIEGACAKARRMSGINWPFLPLNRVSLIHPLVVLEMVDTCERATVSTKKARRQLDQLLRVEEGEAKAVRDGMQHNSFQVRGANGHQPERVGGKRQQITDDSHEAVASPGRVR